MRKGEEGRRYSHTQLSPVVLESLERRRWIKDPSESGLALTRQGGTPPEVIGVPFCLQSGGKRDSTSEGRGTAGLIGEKKKGQMFRKNREYRP